MKPLKPLKPLPSLEIRHYLSTRITCEIADTPQGSHIIGYLEFNHPNDQSKQRNLEIDYIYVKPKFRHKNVASNMIQFLINKYKKVTWISLWTGQEIEKAKKIHFWTENGFTKIAQQNDYYAKGINTSLFVKRIN